MSWTTSLLLAAVLWLDGGLRKIPPASLVMRRVLFGPWRVVEIVRTAGWHAVGRWPSLVLSLAPTEPQRARLSQKQIVERLARIQPYALTLRIIGVTTSVALVFGAPLAVERFGRAGFYYAADALLSLGLITAILSALASRRLGARGWEPVQFSVAFLWPFSGPYAAERVLALAVAGSSPLDVLSALAGAEPFARWARPHAHDALASGNAREPQLLDGFDYPMKRASIEELLAVLPEGVLPGSRFCPRCGASFRDDVRNCEDCAVALVTAVAEAPLVPDKAGVALKRGQLRRGTSIRRKRRRKR